MLVAEPIEATSPIPELALPEEDEADPCEPAPVLTPDQIQLAKWSNMILRSSSLLLASHAVLASSRPAGTSGKQRIVLASALERLLEHSDAMEQLIDEQLKPRVPPTNTPSHE